MKAKEIIIILVAAIGLAIILILSWPFRAYDNYVISQMKYKYIKKLSDIPKSE